MTYHGQIGDLIITRNNIGVAFCTTVWCIYPLLGLSTCMYDVANERSSSVQALYLIRLDLGGFIGKERCQNFFSLS